MLLLLERVVIEENLNDVLMTNSYSSYTDIELAQMISSGSDAEAGFKEIYRRYSGSVHSYISRIMDREEIVEDLFQDTFIKFYENINGERDSINVPGFLITIARNLCLNAKRARKPTVDLDSVEIAWQDGTSYENQELLDLINRSLDLLDEEYREAFVLREYSGLSYQEIADACNTSLSNAKSRVFRAKQKIKAILQPYFKDLCQ